MRWKNSQVLRSSGGAEEILTRDLKAPPGSFCGKGDNQATSASNGNTGASCSVCGLQKPRSRAAQPSSLHSFSWWVADFSPSECWQHERNSKPVTTSSRQWKLAATQRVAIALTKTARQSRTSPNRKRKPPTVQSFVVMALVREAILPSEHAVVVVNLAGRERPLIRETNRAARAALTSVRAIPNPRPEDRRPKETRRPRSELIATPAEQPPIEAEMLR